MVWICGVDDELGTELLLNLLDDRLSQRWTVWIYDVSKNRISRGQLNAALSVARHGYRVYLEPCFWSTQVI